MECRRLAWAVLKLIYRKMELPSGGALAATKSPIGERLLRHIDLGGGGDGGGISRDECAMVADHVECKS